ncbi:MAG TPA: bifunctional glycosyltransferase/class I SAM-dependent methyltransferase [Candidatus Solibacter sp.]|jgi:2-polyprenyl-3-methyl-5-hydroxy-6-metoxy-1,4-benzoquinol methylase
MMQAGTTAGLSYEPRAAFAQHADPAIADCEGKRIGILIVTYNAISTLLPVLKRIPPVVWNNVEEVVVFDDASQDATFELALGIKASHHVPKLHVLKHRKNLGYGGNQKAGYRYFIEKGFDIVVLLHGDGQYAPEILAQMYHPLVAGSSDAVFGSRMMRTFGGPLKGGMPLYKYVGNRILTILENRALGTRLTEFHSGYRAYNLHALAQLDFSRMTDDFHFDTEIIIKLHHQGMKIREVPIPTYYGTELCNVDGLKYARDVLRSVWRYRQTCRSVTRAPEFAEYFVHYPIKHSRHSSHHYARQLVGRDQDVLDIGCGEGFFAAELKADGNRIVGVDAIPTAQHNDALEQFITEDLNAAPEALIRDLGALRFDRVLLLDVLEHLVEPDRLLAGVAGALKPTGRLVVSLPNVANISVRLALLFGRFNYVERGILDRTHLHFYTRKTSRALLEQAGYQILESRVTVMPLELILGLAPKNLLMRAITETLAFFTRIFPGLLGYQLVYLARPRA